MMKITTSSVSIDKMGSTVSHVRDKEQSLMNEVEEPEFQNWVKGIYAQDIARKTLCEIIERKWKQFISELKEEEKDHIDIFMKCLGKSKITHFKAEIKTLRCGHGVCEKLLTRLLALRNFCPEPVESESHVTTEGEIHKTHETYEDNPIEREETDAISNLQNRFSPDSPLTFYWPITKLYVSTENGVSKRSLKELDTVIVAELLERCTLFSFIGSQDVYRELSLRRNEWLQSPSNKVSKEDSDALLQFFVNLLKNFEEANFYQCSDAVTDLQQLINTDLCNEFKMNEYMHLVKLALEMKVSAISFDICTGKSVEAENICLDALMEDTNSLLQLVQDIILEAEPDEVTELKSENESLRIEVKRLQTETEHLKSQGENIGKDVSHLELENRTLTETIERLKQELDNYQHVGCSGKPTATEVEMESITLTWDQVLDLRSTDYFQIHYKKESDSEWHIHPEKHRNTKAVLTNLNPGTTYIFRIKTVREAERIYSPESDAIVTLRSQASNLVANAKQLTPFSQAIYVLPLTEIMINTQAKIGRYLVGIEHRFDDFTSIDCPLLEDELSENSTGGYLNNDNEGTLREEPKTILIFGAAETGSNIVVDGILNYALGVRWNDYFRFTASKTVRFRDNAREEWITCYTLNPEKGNRLTYQLQLIVIPGNIDKSDGHEKVMRQIRELFIGMTGDLQCIAAICLVVEATGVRLTYQQRRALQQIMSLFGKDVRTNICTFRVSADDRCSEDSTAMKESNLPLGNVFNLNAFSSTALLQQAWGMLMLTIGDFLGFVEQVAPCSLQLTLSILNDRISVLEMSRSLQGQIGRVSSKVQQLQTNIKQKHQYELEMKQNEDYQYEVMEVQCIKEDLPAGTKDATICSVCNFTCHRDCSVPKNKKGCSAMGSDDYCQKCPKKCYWLLHENKRYVYTQTEVMVKKTNTVKHALYSSARGRFTSKEMQVKSDKRSLRLDMDQLAAQITDFKSSIQTSNENALQQDPEIDSINSAGVSNWTGSKKKTLDKFEELKRISEDAFDEKGTYERTERQMRQRMGSNLFQNLFQ